MQKYNVSRSSYFYGIGLSYKKADADIRGHFSLDSCAKKALLSHPDKPQGSRKKWDKLQAAHDRIMDCIAVQKRHFYLKLKKTTLKVF